MSLKQLPGTALLPLACASVLLLGCSPGPSPKAAAVKKTAVAVTDSAVTAWNSMLLNPHDRLRKGKNCGGCMVTVRIWPVNGNYQVNPQHPPTTGTPVAKVVNLGTVETEMYGFKPNVDTYFIVDNQNGGTWHLLEVTQAGYNDRPDESGPFAGCNHPPSSVSDADFKTCAKAAADARLKGNSGKIKFASLTSGLPFLSLMQPNDEDPAWTSCTEGCCTMGGGTKEK